MCGATDMKQEQTGNGNERAWCLLTACTYMAGCAGMLLELASSGAATAATISKEWWQTQGCVCFAAPAPHSPWGLGVVEPTTSRKHPKPPCVNVLVALAGTPMTTRLSTSPSGSTNEKSTSISNGSVPWPVFEPNTHTLGAPGCCADCACPSPSLPLSSLSFRS